MKKIIIAAVLILATGLIPSYINQADIKPTTSLQLTNISNRKDIGTAD